MLIMGLEKDYQQALQFIKGVDFTKSSGSSKGFETNIRYLGGLLAANDLRPNRILVEKAIEVTEATLLPLFVQTTTPSGRKVKVPYTYMDLNRNKPEISNTINLAEFGTYSMEFTRLSQVTGNPKYKALVDDLTIAAIEQPTRMPGLFPTSWTVKPFAPVNTSTITIGGGGDSFYEYLIKNYVLQNKENKDLLRVWQESVESIETYMLSPTAQDPSVQFVAIISGNKIYYSSQELICFWPGNILLGITQMQDQVTQQKFKNFADTFFDSCIETWSKTKTGVAPESWSWTPQNDQLETKLNKLFKDALDVKKADTAVKTKKGKRAATRTFKVENAIYDLRPETIESVFYYYRLTGDKRYQDIAWELYLAIERFAKANSGFSRIDNVDQSPTRLQDFQESFFFAETLKYLYLIFADKECISLNNFVFNTEAHPFRLPEPIHYQ
ncbi:glycoside hydrolase [Parasitella parasitica]|nr:glycoside hydrolase [Parasitella parasitica]